MKRLIVFIPLLLLFAVFVFNAATAPTFPKSVAVVVKPTATPTPSPFSEDKLWSLIQKWRTDNGFQPYIKDQRLCAIAEQRAPEVVQEYISHQLHKGFYARYSNSSYVLSENIAEDPNENTMLQAWIHSPEHLENLEKPYIYSCIACKSLPNIFPSEGACSQIFSSF